MTEKGVVLYPMEPPASESLANVLVWYWYRHHKHLFHLHHNDSHHFATWSWYKEILVPVSFAENNCETRSHFRGIFSTEFYLIVSSCFAIPTKLQPLAPYRLSVRCRLTWMWSHTQHCFGQSLLYMNTAVWKVIKLLGSVHGRGREQQHPTPQMKTKQLCRSPCTWSADSDLVGLYIMAEYFHLNIGPLPVLLPWLQCTYKLTEMWPSIIITAHTTQFWSSGDPNALYLDDFIRFSNLGHKADYLDFTRLSFKFSGTWWDISLSYNATTLWPKSTVPCPYSLLMHQYQHLTRLTNLQQSCQFSCYREVARAAILGPLTARLIGTWAKHISCLWHVRTRGVLENIISRRYHHG